MKKFYLFVVTFLCLLVIPSVTFADDIPVPVAQLPEAVKTFVQKTFPELTIVYAEKDNEVGGAKYEIRLSDGTKVEFDRKLKWEKIDCNVNPVPEALVPTAIDAYVKANYPNTIITQIDKERNGYEIELSNDIELKFNKKGQLIGTDY